MDRISDITLFIRVVDLGSISAAARSENLSLSVASLRLQRLEESLGVRLLNRTTRRLYPTPEGEMLVAEGRPLIDGLLTLGENFKKQPLGDNRHHKGDHVGLLWPALYLPAAGRISGIAPGREHCCSSQ